MEEVVSDGVEFQQGVFAPAIAPDGVRFIRANCAVHGEVNGAFEIRYHDVVPDAEPYSTGPICPKCWIDSIKARVRHVSPLPEG